MEIVSELNPTWCRDGTQAYIEAIDRKLNQLGTTADTTE